MKTKSFAQILIGLIVLAVGVGLLLNGLNIINFGDFMKQWWPTIIIAIGVIGLITNFRQWQWPLVISGFGVALLLKQLGIIDVNIFGLIWPTILILVGLIILFRGNWDKADEANDDIVKSAACFGGQNIRQTSKNFKGGELTAIFGGVDLDLRDAHIEKEAKIDVVTIFGGADIKVPEGWIIKVTGLPIFGGWEDNTKKPTEKNAPVLRISATCLFGGFSVQNKS